jgi:hypothetical protein
VIDTNYSFSNRLSERFWIWLAHKLPRPLLLWAVVRVANLARDRFGSYPANQTYAKMTDVLRGK